jgi:predicted phage-related endonuclease
MKALKFNSEQEWMEGRQGKITGSRLGGVFSKKDKKPLKGYYEIIAERVAIPQDGENVLDRGKRLEDESADRFEKETGRKVDRSLVLWCREDNENIAVSPDGVVSETEAFESKSLNSASHIEAYLTKKIPSDYEHQVLQYFIVNDKLEKLYFAFYDPRMPKDFFYFTVNRSEVQEKVTEYLALERTALAQIEDVVNQLTF